MSVNLDKFKNGTVLEGALSLFGSLGVKFNTLSELPVDLLGMLPQPSKAVTAAFNKVDSSYFLGSIDDATLRGTDEALSLNDEIHRIDQHYKGIMAFALEAKPGTSLTRTEIATLTRALNRISKAAPVALVIRYGDRIALALCERTPYVQSGHTGEKPGVVNILRDIKYNDPHRGHLDILSELQVSGPTTFEELYKKWFEVFNSETLTKRFYQDLSNWYALALTVINFPNNINTNEDNTKYNQEGAIRLITRLIFVWFLKEKNLIPSELFDPKYIGEKLLKDFNPQAPTGWIEETVRQSHYYRGILQNLFFATLNCPLTKEGSKVVDQRRFKDKGRSQFDVNTLMRYKDLFKDPDLFIEICNKVPFLNGGLFDCLDEKEKGMYYDGFSERPESIRKLCIPDYLFFSDNIKADLSSFYDDPKHKNDNVNGLIRIFNHYKFTIEENTPIEKEVALDPELLGKVFENLLALYEPDSHEVVRNITGSFYTPRNVVQFMVEESLVAHLNRVVGSELESQYRKLLSYTDDSYELTEEQRKAIIQALFTCKILDPACGSGAFPMGILQQMVHVLTKIDPDNSQWREKVIEEAERDSADAFRTQSEKERNERLEDIKRSFNEKINGPDYARKLYLIENCIYGVDIQPIAIQISKLRFFISLVIDQKCNNDPTDNYGIRPLPNLEAKFVAANSLICLNKTSTLGDTMEVLSLKKEIKQMSHRILYGIKSYSRKKELIKKITEKRLQLAKELNSIGMYSFSESLILAQWDMFNQNSYADFFDSDWMFGITKGFDIVIGNPPYFLYQASHKEEISLLRKSNDLKSAFGGKLNAYKLFIAKSLSSFVVPCGFLCFIFQNSFLADKQANIIRREVLINNRIIFIDSYPERDNKKKRMFESVKMSVCIALIQKLKIKNYEFVVNFWDDKDNKSGLQTKFSCNDILSIDPEGMSIPRILQKDLPLIVKMNSIKKRIPIKCFEGELNMTTHKNLFTRDVSSPKILKGASIQRFYWTENMSQGEIEYLDETQYISKFRRSEKVNHHNSPRLAMQGMTGANDKIRLIGCIVPRGMYLANSTNYILQPLICSLEALLGLFNSTIINWYFKCFSTNSNVNGYEIDNIPWIDHNQGLNKLSIIVSYIIDKRDKIDYSNIIKKEQEIDFLVYHLYNLTYDEVLIVDPNPPFSREEYDNFNIEDYGREE